MTRASLHVAQCGGTATRADLLEVMTRTALGSALASGEIVRHRRGVYGLPPDDAALEAAACLGAVLGHRTAALHHGWGVLHEPDAPELVVDRHRRISLTCDQPTSLRYRPLPDHDTNGPVTTPLRTVVDCARDLPTPEALAVADSALRSGEVGRAELARAVTTLPRTHRGRATRVLEAASASAANPFESGLHGLAIDAAGPIWLAQARVVLRSGLALHADVGAARLRIALEADSHEFHKSRGDVVRDCHRYDEMILAGWVVLRFAWEHVMFHPDWVREVIAWVVRERAGRSYGSSSSTGRAHGAQPDVGA